MAQITIDVDGVPTLFSPVLAHSLEPGDRTPITFADGTEHLDTVLSVLPHKPGYLALTTELAGTELPAVNCPVLRAVGARAARGGAR